MPFFQWLLCPTKCVGQAWDKVGTRDKRDTKSFFKIGEKSMKIGCKSKAFSYLRFSRGHEKGVKNVSGSEPAP